ncbi:MAG: hypothetical protein V4555_15375, partial [Acidobacteriota bacterium]
MHPMLPNNAIVYHHPVPDFTTREAKEFLVDHIVAEALRTSTPLSEAEHRMLYFTETGWMPYDFAEVNEAFERECGTPGAENEYEAKITNLIRSYLLEARQSNPADLQRWHDAVAVLSEEDHYILIMVTEARRKQFATKPPGRLGPVTLGFIIGAILVGILTIAVQ